MNRWIDYSSMLISIFALGVSVDFSKDASRLSTQSVNIAYISNMINEIKPDCSLGFF